MHVCVCVRLVCACACVVCVCVCVCKIFRWLMVLAVLELYLFSNGGFMGSRTVST